MITSRRRGTFSSLLTLALVGVVWLVINEPRTQRTRLLTGQSFDVLAITRDGSIGQLLRNAPESRREAVLISYYSSLNNLDSPAARQEAREVVQIGAPLALQSGDSLIAVQAIRTIGPRWSPLVRGRIHFFGRMRDGSWDEVFASQAQP